MTVRCDVCGTENRDKAMFCRGCAGKLPAFVPTRKPADGHPDASRPATRVPGASAPSAATTASSPATMDRSRFGLADPRTVVFALLMAMLGAVVAWFALTSTDAERPALATPSTPAIAERLPPEASLSTGETLEDARASDGAAVPPALASSSTGGAHPATPDDVSQAGPPPEIPPTDTEPTPPTRSTGRRSSTPVAPGGSGRASDPRAGCEHLFFAFAARCEANHCQLPAYARHPRCEVVREQRRRDDARRNSMPTS